MDHTKKKFAFSRTLTITIWVFFAIFIISASAALYYKYKDTKPLFGNITITGGEDCSPPACEFPQEKQVKRYEGSGITKHQVSDRSQYRKIKTKRRYSASQLKTLAKSNTTAKEKPTTKFEAPLISNAKPVPNTLNSLEHVYSNINTGIKDLTTHNDECVASNSVFRIAPQLGTYDQPFRKLPVMHHDKLETSVSAFPEIVTHNSKSVFNSVRDDFSINYGSQGPGAQLLANRKKIEPGKDCAECEYEEFFLESWIDGDPALLMTANPTTHVATAALFPDDPSNVHHSYLGDPVRFRNIHAVPKETHVFHLHAHQWLQSPRDPNSTYLDSQTISPGASYTYEINYGGTGNRNLTLGDSIFHCHLYPHFAQGMWGLWRSHDVFVDGSTTSSNVAAQFLVNGRAQQPSAPYADPCPANFTPDPENGGLRPVPLRKYRAAWIQFATEDNAIPNTKTLTVKPFGWHDRQSKITYLKEDAIPMLQGALAPEPLFFRANSGDCIDYRVTNLFQNKALNLDDFQVFQDTDIIGQHIHLVKFDVTSSDGAGNGWPYESGALAGEAVVETIEAIRKFNNCTPSNSRNGTNACSVALVHPKFEIGPDGTWLGAQTLIERWWADPLMNRATHDRTLRMVFTHDHYVVHGDPCTPILSAYPGDRVQVRILQGAQEEQHVMNIHGNKWYFEPGTPHDATQQNNSGFTNSQAIGVSEHFEFDVNDKTASVSNNFGTTYFRYQLVPTDNRGDGVEKLRNNTIKNSLEPVDRTDYIQVIARQQEVINYLENKIAQIQNENAQKEKNACLCDHSKASSAQENHPPEWWITLLVSLPSAIVALSAIILSWRLDRRQERITMLELLKLKKELGLDQKHIICK